MLDTMFHTENFQPVLIHLLHPVVLCLSGYLGCDRVTRRVECREKTRDYRESFDKSGQIKEIIET
ncbi:hypothetical protein BCEN4_1640012 [Burkholderia cenocepacia]|nr:hypothetical protein BCEN4_1640012 [Burkholderia cenocepacia]